MRRRQKHTHSDYSDKQLQKIAQIYQSVLCVRLKGFNVEVRVTRKDDKNANGFNSMERLLIGWQEIADFMQCSKWTAQVIYRDEMKKAGVLFYRRIRIGEGRVARMACAFPSAIVAWSVRRNINQVHKKVVRLLVDT
jgi:hypothetical protein